MSGWPPITEPELLQRLAMDDEEFRKMMRSLVAEMPPRDYEAALLALAFGYPWERPQGSYLLSDGDIAPLESLAPPERGRLMREYAEVSAGRLPLLAIGSNGAPEALERKFAHFDAVEDRTVLVLTGRLRDFDVGVAAQPALYGSMPATLFPSPGTAVRTALLWVTPAQFTQLTWSEISYQLGRLQTRFEVDEGGVGFDEVLVFVSRFGAFCIDGKPAALAAVPADDRTAEGLTQEQLLDAAAALALGPGAGAEALVRAIFEDMAAIAPKFTPINRASLPFASERWTPYGQPSGA